MKRRMVDIALNNLDEKIAKQRGGNNNVSNVTEYVGTAIYPVGV